MGRLVSIDKNKTTKETQPGQSGVVLATGSSGGKLVKVGNTRSNSAPNTSQSGAVLATGSSGGKLVKVGNDIFEPKAALSSGSTTMATPGASQGEKRENGINTDDYLRARRELDSAMRQVTKTGDFDALEQARQRVAELEGDKAGNRTVLDEIKTRLAMTGQDITDFAENFFSGAGHQVLGQVSALDEAVAESPVGKAARTAADWLHDKTGWEIFNVQDVSDIYGKDSALENQAAADILEQTTRGRGALGSQFMQTGQAAGNMMLWSGILGPASEAMKAAGVTDALSGAANGSNALGASAMQKVGSSVSRAGARFALELINNPGNLGISVGSGASSYSLARDNGASPEQAFTNGLLKGLTEYFSNKLFSGTPFEDSGEKGYVTMLTERIADRLGQSGALERLAQSAGGQVMGWLADKAGEGLEEVVTGIADPLIDRLTYDPETDLATADELVDEFVGGVFLSLLMSGGEALIASASSEAQNPAQEFQTVGNPVNETSADMNRMPHGDFSETRSTTGMDGARTVNQYAGNKLGQAGQYAFSAFYDGKTDASGYIQAMTWYYNAGQEGVKIGNVRDNGLLNQQQREAAYLAGQADAEKAAGAAHETGRSAEPGLTRDEYVKTTMSVADADRIDRVAKELGVSVRFDDRVAGGAANAQINESEIVIAKDARNPVLQVLGHEWTHRMQELAPEEYGRFRDEVKGTLGNKVKDILYNYQRDRIEITEQAALDEAVADYAGELLSDGRVLDEFLEAHREDKGLLRKLWEAIKELARKLTGAEKRMARSVEGKLRAMLDAAAAANEKNAAPEGGEARYSLKSNDLPRQNIRYDDTEAYDAGIERAMKRNQDTGNVVELSAEEIGVQKNATDWTNVKETRKYIKKIITDIMGDSVYFEIGDGTLEAYFTSAARDHYVGYPTAEKAAAAEKFSELVQKSSYAFSSEHDIHSEEGKRVEANIWDYFVASVKIGDTTTPVIFSVRSIDRDLRAQIYAINMQTEAAAFRGNGHQDEPVGRSPSYEGFTASDENTIAQSGEKSNTQFSLKSPENLRELREENDLLREMYKNAQKRAEYWKGQTKVTENRQLRPGDVHVLTKQIIRNYDGTIQAGEVEGAIKRVGDGIRFRNLSYEAAKEIIVRDVAGPIVRSAEVLADDENAQLYHEVRAELKKPMLLAPEYAHDVSENWGDWRRANMGRVNVSVSGKGTPVDVAYAQYSETWPALFPAEITHPADQVLKMVEVMETLRPIYENPHSAYMAEAIETCANDILKEIMDEGVRETPMTYADRMAWNQERMRERYREALAAERQSRHDQVNGILEHLHEARERNARQKEDTAMRDKLLKLARRLSKIKTDPVTRAFIDERIGMLDTFGKELTGDDIREIYTLQQWYYNEAENNPDFIRDALTEKRLARLGKKQINELSASEVADLVDVLLNIENQIREGKKLIDADDRRTVYIQGEQVIANVRQSRGSSSGNAFKETMNGIVNGTLSPMRAIRRFTEYVDNDPMYLAAKAINDGQRDTIDYRRRAWEKFIPFTKDKAFNHRIAGKKAEAVKIAGFEGISVDKKYGAGVNTFGVKEVEITPAMRMSLYLHFLNDQNLRHMEEGGVRVPDMKLYRQGKIAEAYERGTTVKLTPSAVRSIVAKMTPQERAFAEAVRRYFNGMSRESINEVSVKLLGYELAQVQDYFPITTDPDFTRREIDALKFDGTIEGMGFLKDRQDYAKNPIMLRDMTDVLLTSIDQHARFYGLAIPVRNFNKLWNMTSIGINEDGGKNSYADSVKNAVGQMWGKEGKKYIEKMLADMQGAGKDLDGFGKLLAKARSNYAGAVLTLNASVAMKQAASYPTAAAVVGWKPLRKALRYMLPGVKVDTNLINLYTPLLWYRSQGYSTQELGDIRSQDQGVMKELLGKKGLNWIQGMDVKTTSALWKAAEYYVQDQKLSPAVGSDAYYNAVANVYNQIIEETQPNYTTMQRPQLLRSDNQLLQDLMMFKTQPFQNFNILYDAMGNLQAKRNALINATAETQSEAKAAYQEARKKAGWAIGSQIVQTAVFAGMTFAWNMIRGKHDKYEDKDGEMDFWSTLGGIGKDMIGGVASMIPFGSDVWELASSLAFKETYYGFDSVTASAVNDMTNALVKAGKALAGIWESVDKGEEIDWNEQRLKFDSVLDAVTKVVGVPYENVNNLFNAVFRDVAMGISKAKTGNVYEGTYAYLRLTASPSSKSGEYYDNLYEAYTKDPETYQGIYEKMIESGDFTADKIKNAMEARMKKAQGVEKVSELENRYLSPEQQTRYDDLLGVVSESKLWKDAEKTAQDAALDALYEWAIGSSEGQKIQEKIDGGVSVGLDDTEYMLYLLARNMADEPTASKKYGTYTNDEIEAAIRMVPGLSDAERDYLWGAQGKKEKSLPAW